MKYLFLITIFISSYLLFAVQPMVAKIILPNFGGGSAVWTACMLFYQSFLLFGYLYSYGLSRLSSIRHQALIHGVVVVTGALLMPVTPDALITSTGTLGPFADIFILSMIGIGVPYFVLATTSPLIQYWMSHSAEKKSTYRLYSVSNIAALLALFSYPLVIEYSFSLQLQTFLWSMVYLVFSVGIALCVYGMFKGKGTSEVPATTYSNTSDANLGIGTKVAWFLLAATGVILLVSTTNNITVNIPPIPFLWILPLAIYLLTYIVVFFDERFYGQWYWKLLFSAVTLVAVFLFFIGTHFSVITQLILYLIVLLVGCMICHGELAKSKPDRQHLTLFYLILAAGGAAGSLFASVIATQFFTQYYEFIVGIGLVYGLSLYMDFEKRRNRVVKAALVNRMILTSAFGAAVFFGLFFFLKAQFNQYNVAETRNFYGTLQVKDIETSQGMERRLIDGYTSHGTQSLEFDGKPLPLSYYRKSTGIGKTLKALNAKPSKKIGVIGLGTGALAYYGQPDDDMVFYELNPSVEAFAKSYFDFLPNAKANIGVKLGDARVTLEKEWQDSGSAEFDILVVDAFSSDAIPTHLITKEALRLYLQHLVPDGVLAFHISNSYLDLKPVLKQHESELGLQALYFSTLPKGAQEHGAEWVVLTNNEDYLRHSDIREFGQALGQVTPESVDWSDNYSSLLSVLK